ncbi:S41 family peptidase [Pontibacter sp. MBLB2868]|uniref:S41 family peptidase n=1 Tax=Pontibacter sp. MBLB2868 TaxID=3451555 RepID=UPI003F74DE6B
MKLSNYCFSFALVCVTCASVFAAPGSLDKKATDRVATLTKVWGLMKYYHSEAAAGSINWDSVFVAYVPKVVAAKDQKEFAQLMDKFYTEVPAPKLAATFNLPKADTIRAVFSAKEISGYHVSLGLKRQLQELYERHLPVKSKFITDKYKEYTLDYVLFQENPMAETAYPDKATRLLALARYWNTINFFYPHKLTIGKSWESILQHYIPVFADAPNKLAYHQAILRLNKELKDSHTFVNSPAINAMWGPNPYFFVKYIEGKFVITKLQSDSLAKAEDIRVGDVIESINGKPVRQRANELHPFLAGSNEAATNRDIANYLLNVDSDASVTLEIGRGGKRFTRKISRYPYQELMKLSDKPQEQYQPWKEVEEGIFWVDFAEIKDPVKLNDLFEDLERAKTVIMDLRKYPDFKVYQQTLPTLLANSFFASTTTNAIVNYPGYFTQSKSMFERTDTSKLVPYNGRMVVLVDEYTQSLGESFACMLAQRPNTIIMGSQTAGTTGNITWLPLPGGANVAFTGVGERGVNHTFEQRKGVRIDKMVKPTVASIAAGKDIVIEAAVAEARKETTAKATVKNR